MALGTGGGGGSVPLNMANSVSREWHLLVRSVSRLTASERSEALSALGLRQRAWCGVSAGRAGCSSRRGQGSGEQAQVRQGGGGRGGGRLLSMVLSRSSCVEMRLRRRTCVAHGRAEGWAAGTQKGVLRIQEGEHGVGG